MSEELDRAVLSLVASLIGSRNADAMLVQRIWLDRESLIHVMTTIRDWDMGHSEALSLEVVQREIELELEAVERPR